MSPIPSLPTDNLYKFCAVAGCVAIIVSGLVAFQGWRDLLGQQHSMENRAAEQKWRKFDLSLEEMATKPWQQPESSDPKEAEKYLKEAEKRFQEQAKRIKPLIDEAEKKLEADGERLDIARYDFGIVGVGAAIFALFGFALAGYGFRNWRILQLKQDQLLELELQQSRAQGAKTT